MINQTQTSRRVPLETKIAALKREISKRTEEREAIEEQVAEINRQAGLIRSSVAVMQDALGEMEYLKELIDERDEAASYDDNSDNLYYVTVGDTSNKAVTVGWANDCELSHLDIIADALGTYWQGTPIDSDTPIRLDLENAETKAWEHVLTCHTSDLE